MGKEERGRRGHVYMDDMGRYVLRVKVIDNSSGSVEFGVSKTQWCVMCKPEGMI